MRNILTLIFLFLFTAPAFSQITLTGTRDVKVNTSNEDVNFIRKEIDVTKVVEEQSETKTNFIIKNQIGSSTVVKENETVKVDLPNNPSGTDSKQIILDLNEAKTETVPTYTKPTVTTPVVEPTVIAPKVTTPVVTQPVITEPVVNTPKVTTPVVTQPVVTEPVVNTPKVTTPVVTQPVVTEPVVNTPKVTTPVVTEPVVNTPKVTTPVVTEPVVNTPKVTTPVVTKPTLVSNKNASSNTESGSAYPEKKANGWAIGINTGIPFVKGDVKSKIGYGGSFTIQKALGHVVSLRYQSFFGQTFGQDWKLQVSDSQFKNYKTRISDHSIQGVFTLNNINFYKREPKAIFNIITGVGFSTRHSWTNTLDENGAAYDYSLIPTAVDRGDRKDILNSINDINDSGYETIMTNDKLDAHIKNTEINPAVILGIGLGFKLSKKVDLTLEHRVSWHNSDNYDAYTANNNNDWLHYSSLGLNFKIGKNEESMFWMNPVYAAYDDINDLKQKVDEGDLLKDEDQDGIADIFDKDLNTPANVLVDSRGVASDLDKDGVPDFKDKEPFTPIGAKVNMDGIAIDSDNDGIADLYDLENNTPTGKSVDSKGRSINTNSSNYNPSALNNSKELGMILFNSNSKNIPTEYYPVLYDVLSYMNSNPSANIVITGHADVKASETYNMELSKERSIAVYKMLTEIFKIPSSRVEYNYLGEQSPLISGLPENFNAKYEPGHQMNRRVTIALK